MSKNRVTFRNPVSGHVVSTGLPTEQNRLRALGYVEKDVKPSPAPVRKPTPPTGEDK